MKKSTVILIAAAAAAAAAGLYVGIRVLFGNEDIRRDTSDPAQYGEWYGLLGHTNLLIFPEQLPASAKNTEYSYFNDGNNIGPSSLVYLKCTYDAETVEAEKARLAAIGGVRKDTAHYPAEAYVTMLTQDECEYALLSDDTVTYIYCCEGLHPRTPDSSCLRTSAPAQADYFSVYESLSYNDLKYWPESWKH